MKSPARYGWIVGLGIVGLTAWASVQAQQAGPRFDSDQFLREFDSFVDHRQTLDPDQNVPARHGVVLGGDSAPAAGGLRLFDPLDAEATTRVEGHIARDVGATASAHGGAGRVATPSGVLRGVGAETRSAEIGLSYEPITPSGLWGQAFRVGLRSSITTARSEVLGSPLGHYLQRQIVPDYFVGLDLSYWRFQLDASLSRSSALWADGYEGYGLGIGYDFGGLVTRIGIGDYRRDAGTTGLGIAAFSPLGGEPGRLIEYELGAAYKFSDVWEISGGVRLYDIDSSASLLDLAGSGRETLFIGTRLGF